mgnify:CR=1 FL=1
MTRYKPEKITGWYKERNDQIVEAYRRGESTNQIAEYWRLDVKTVTEILHGYGVKRVGRVW